MRVLRAQSNRGAKQILATVPVPVLFAVVGWFLLPKKVFCFLFFPISVPDLVNIWFPRASKPNEARDANGKNSSRKLTWKQRRTFLFASLVLVFLCKL